jgi:hypothetical protein
MKLVGMDRRRNVVIESVLIGTPIRDKDKRSGNFLRPLK